MIIYDVAQNDESIIRNKITIILFFCSLLVIWIHAYNLETYGIDENGQGIAKFVYFIECTWRNLTQIAVPFFFFVSGYLFYRTFAYKGIREKYKSRVCSILIPYLIWCTVYYLYFVVLTNTPFIKNLMNAEQVTLSWLGYLNALWPNEYYTLWFLKEIIIYIAGCPLVYIMYKNNYAGAAILLLLLANARFQLVSIPLQGYLYYSTGVYIALNFKHIEYFKSKLFSVLSVIFFLILFGVQFSILEFPIMRLLFFAAFWFMLDLLPLPRQYPWWMKISFFTYVAHDMFLEAYEKIILIVFGKSAVFALFDYLFIPVIVFGTLVAIARFLRKYTPVIWYLCTGGR